jgi:endonuclease/exonuclease/phosphatase (EEP) superfamily protein YafD
MLVMLAQPPDCGTALVAADGGATKGEASVWQALRGAGFDAVHAAGAMGNIKAESNFDAQIVQGGGHSTRPTDAGGGGYGLVQWTPGRKLSDYIGTATPTVANQVATLKAQLDGRGPHSEKAAGDAFWATRDVASAARVFHLRYERSASKDSTQRVRNALDIFQRLQGSPAPAPTTGGAELALSYQPPTTSGTCGVTANVATWNACYCNSDGNVLDGIRALIASGADVISLQEQSATARRRLIERTFPDFLMVGPDASTPVLVKRSRFSVLSQETQLVIPRLTPMEGGLQGNRWIVSATLRDVANGQTFAIVNTHMLPTVQKHGKFRKGWPKRIGLYRKHLRILMAHATELRTAGPVVITGDFNFDGDPDGAYAKAGFASSTKTLGELETRGKRDIDLVLSNGATPATQQKFSPHGSDHRPVLVQFIQTNTSTDGGGPVPAEFNKQGNPRTVEQAVAWMQGNMPNGAPGEPVRNACERYMNLAYGLGGGYPTAIAHWNAPGPKTVGTSVPPRGAVVFIRSQNAAGHVILSLGNGQAISTDYWQGRYVPGRLGQGSVTDIAKAMGGPVLGWRAPNFRVGSEAV